MIKLIVFDLDGTLVDSKGLYVNTIQEVLKVHSMNFKKYDISKAMGPKTRQTLLNLTNIEPNLLDQLRNEINPRVEMYAASLKLCPYVQEVLRDIKKNKKQKILIMTNSTRKYIFTALNKKGIWGLFDEVFGAEDFLNKETGFHTIFKNYHVKPDETLYVGDRRSDFDIAKSVGCQILLVKARSWDKTKISTDKQYRKVLINDLRGVLKMVAKA